jgi:rfaE bifunctional protein kinase chain/domain
MKFRKDQIETFLKAFRGKKVLVVGDLMLDRYLWGQVTRLSPEAPVPIVEIEDEYSRLGGAANVGNNLASLGAVPFLVGIVGADNSGRELLRLMKEQDLSTEGVLIDEGRPTTVKTRVIAHTQHVVRTDRESREPVSATMLQRLKDLLREMLPDMDAVILEDYNKGLLVPELIHFVIGEAKRQDKIVTVDPKFDNFFAYRQVTVFKPNRREVEGALGVRLQSRDDVTRAAEELFRRLECECLLITLGEDGMALFNSDRKARFIPTRARKVHDVSGAGDTVISTLTLALTAGASFDEAAALANYAAGIVCGEVGIVPITPESLLNGIVSD